MPVQLSFPGVYVQEERGGGRAITGVATAVTAFVGRTRQGPVDEPALIHSFDEFERIFGGLWENSGLSYALRDYYLNGGRDALIVRLYKPKSDEAGVASAVIDGLVLSATDPGSWPNKIISIALRHRNDDQRRADAFVDAAAAAETAAVGLFRVAHQAVATANGELNAATADLGNNPSPQKLERLAKAKAALALRNAESAEAFGRLERAEAAKTTADAAKVVVDNQATETATSHGLQANEIFHLDIIGTDGQTLETFADVTVKAGSSRRVDQVLRRSSFVRVRAVPDQRPGETTVALDGGDDGGALDRDAYGVSTFVPVLEGVDGVSLLCVPPSDPSGQLDNDVWKNALTFCARRNIFLLVDPPTDPPTSDANSPAGMQDWLTKRNLTGDPARNAAVYFPRVRYADPLRDGAIGEFAPCGAVAGIMARTDTNRGVWKAPAGIEAGIVGVSGLAVELTDGQNGELNPVGINCLRTLPNIGSVVWGSRTLAGDDALADEYKYVPVRRVVLFLKESLYRGTQWVVFEPNDAGLWAQIRTTLGAFMQDLFKQGAFQGSTPREAYFVKCDAETTTQYDIDRGIVNIRVGFAPLKPAEFVVITIQQKTAAAA